LQPGTPPIVGKAAFHDFMKQAFASSPTVKVVKYVPDIHDIQLSGNVAYEWGYFDAAQKSSAQQAPQILHAKLLRVMRRQVDGSWKFVRVMWLPD
jgi:ketosteroid isomerase-like protein